MSFEETCEDCHNKKKIKNLFFPNKSNFERMIKQIKKCETSMFICMYQITHSTIIDTLIELAKKGRSINIVIDQHQDEVEEKRNELISKLLVFSDFKIKMALRFGEGLMHNKFCVIDEQTIICGSANWTFQAFTHNEEFIQIQKDKSSAKQFLEQYKKIWDKSKTIQFVDSQISYIPNKKCKEEIKKPLKIRRFIKKDRRNYKKKFFKKRKNGFRQFNKRKQQQLTTHDEKNSLQNTPNKAIQIQAETHKCSEEGKDNLKDNQEAQKQIITSSLFDHLQNQFNFQTICNSQESWANQKIHTIRIISKNKSKLQNQKNEIIIIDDEVEVQLEENQQEEEKIIFD